MAQPGTSKMQSKLPLPPQRKGMGIPRLATQAGPSSLNSKQAGPSSLLSKRVTRQSLSAPDLRKVGAAPVAVPPQRNATSQRSAQPVPRKRPAAAPIGPSSKKPLMQVDSNKPSAKPAPLATGKRKVAAWDTKGQLELANAKIEKLREENETLTELTHNAQAVKDTLDACEKEKGEITNRLQEANNKRKLLEEQIGHLQDECLSLRNEKDTLEKRLERLEMQYCEAKRKIENLGTQIELCEKEKHQLKIVSTEFERNLQKEREINLQLTTKLDISSANNKALMNDVLNLEDVRRRMHNEILDLKGNIRVFCRVRPVLEKECGKAVSEFNFPDEGTLSIKSLQDFGSAKKSNEFSFTYDKVFSPNHNQDDIYVELSQLVQSVLDGFNVCVFAYGQTGSGKTYTMQGGDTIETQGMIPRSIETIFSTIEKQKQMGWKFTVSCSFLEIYNEVIRDLLNPKSTLSYDIKMVGNDDVYVTNLKVEEVQSAADLNKFLAEAQKNRFVAATVMNHESSRSHSIAQIKVESSHEERNIQCQGTINLIDLAGSEKYNNENLSDRKKETCNINKSLSTLTLVIMHLVDKNAHVPFRDSKLTHLLMPSLKGNSKTLMLVNIAPLEDCFSESVSSLKFASRVSGVQLWAKRQVKSKMVSNKK